MVKQNTNERYGRLPPAPQRRTPGSVYSIVDRGLRECLATRQFTRNEMIQVLDFFGKKPPECAYCGSKDVERWDHVVSIRDDGETVLGNVVPACQPCDDSKGMLKFEEWMKSEKPNSPTKRRHLDTSEINARIQKIREYVAYFGYNVRKLKDRLSDNERQMLAEIRALNKESRRKTERLVQEYRKRTGGT